MTPRAAHLAWCKQRALALVRDRKLDEALASFMSDLAKEDCTADALRTAHSLNRMAVAYVNGGDHRGLATWIRGFG